MSPMSSYFERLHSKQINIKVGGTGNTKDFVLPNDFLVHASPWFDSALKEDRFREGKEGVIELPEDIPVVFEAFAYYLYNGYLTFSTPQSGEELGAQIILCARIWMFGDRYLHQEVQNAAIQRLCNLMNDDCNDYEIPIPALTTCYICAKDASPLRVLVTEYIVQKLHTAEDTYDIEEALSSTKGFLNALHHSETTLHTLPQADFPRCKKPRKFADVFYLGPAYDYDDEANENFSCTSRWNRPDNRCDDCGFVDQSRSRHVCRSCKKKRCNCGKQNWALLCPNCAT